jgi:hypothetical protein
LYNHTHNCEYTDNARNAYYTSACTFSLIHKSSLLIRLALMPT